jgi:hypothetical protein
MSRGTKIVILIIGGVIVIGLIVYFIIVPVFKANVPAANVNVNNNLNSSLPVTNNQPPATNTPPPPAEVAPESKEASAAQTIARIFSERFATYSNQNGLANLNDLQAISTPAVWNYIQGGYRSEIVKSMPGSGSYYAVSATALSVKIVPISDTEVSATVPMQLIESGTSSKVSYATLNLKLKKVNDAWLVSWEEWEK